MKPSELVKTLSRKNVGPRVIEQVVEVQMSLKVKGMDFILPVLLVSTEGFDKYIDMLTN